MSLTASQLGELIEQIRAAFDGHPLISVSPGKGNPPDHYLVTYSFPGISKNTKGEIEEANEHTVELAIPFGFPHFPPSCKPKSNIFHPDFDPGAICLGDFWHSQRTLPDLIIHIGRLLNGELYSTTNAFNDEAAEWYTQNADRFPLSALQLDITPNNEMGDNADEYEIDTLDDSDLRSDFGDLSLDKTDDYDGFDDSFPEIDEPSEHDFGQFQRLASQRKYYQLISLLEKQPGRNQAFSELAENAAIAIRQAEELFDEAKVLEDQGKVKKALKSYEKTRSHVADFPAIKSQIKRMEQAVKLLADVVPPTADEAPEPLATTPEPEPIAPEQKQPDSHTNQHRRGQPATAEPSSFSQQKRSGIRLIIYTTLALTLCLGAGGGYFFYSFKKHLVDGENDFRSCTEALQAAHFQRAEQACRSALNALETVKFIKQDRVQELKAAINQTLSSDQLKQGLLGKELVDGRYLSKEDAEKLRTFKKSFDEAETLYTQNQWQAALDRYQTLLALRAESTLIDNKIFDDIEQKAHLADFRVVFDKAEELVSQQNWRESVLMLRQAQKKLGNLGVEDHGNYTEKITRALLLAQFEEHTSEAEQFFSQSDWQKATEAYRQALSSAERASPPQTDKITAIQEKIQRAQIYTTIHAGNEAFEAGDWESAIAAYLRARNFLQDNSREFNDASQSISLKKLDRIILQTSLIRDRQTAKAAVDANDLESGRNWYRQALASIETSSFAKDPDFQALRQEFATAIEVLNDQIFMNDKIQYLKDNFQRIFKANYPGVMEDNLDTPVITYTKQIEDSLIFRLQCTERGRGRPLALVMFYAYDKQTDRWRLYYE